jgi:F-type H+-transporting ATPase subunit b
MDQTLRQVGELLLGAIPTVIILLLLWVAYALLVSRPLHAILAKRRALTEGAVLKARADVAAAEARTAEYEQKLREARSAIFKAMEARRQAVQQAKDAAIAQAREIAHQQIHEAQVGIDKEMAEARAGLQAESERLANRIIQAVLRPAGAIPAAGGSQ